LRGATVLLVLSLVLLTGVAPGILRRASLNLALIRCLKVTECHAFPCGVAVAADDDRSEYHTGLDALRRGDFKSAALHLRVDLRMQPRDTLGGYFLGMAYRQAGNERAALAVWRHAQNGRGFRARGWQLGSIEDLKTAIAIGGVDPDTFYKLGDVLWGNGERESAGRLYEQGLKSDEGRRASTLLARGRVAELSKDWIRAIGLYEMASEAEPDGDEPYCRIASVYDQGIKNPAAAVSWCARCVAKNNALTGYLCAADISRAHGDFTSAHTWLARARSSYPASAAVLVAMAHTEEAEAKPSEADLLYEAASKLEPHNFWIPFYRGELALQNGDFPRAAKYLEASAAINPTSPYLYAELSRTYERLGQTDAAATACRNARRFAPNDPAISACSTLRASQTAQTSLK
jgi:tetratricopeptide (TPR) repeat protein